ncbi:hypothetical protein HU200_036663 [Digitaria exilis]|uniref:Uncharacterized protein n=1 Tax=Digitaria exilis TaxID=1010633 RepID=A0A835BGD0_9POAL|nr:hypothetical protein HU200_036663 [Digitaria exilis]CAB3477722.1 unnamed protein product [Digitaria exilis]
MTARSGRTMCGRAGEPAVRKGPWTLEEDLILVSYISQHGEGSWDSLARAAGLNRNGKSCRLRWLNYLRPGVRRGSITAAEDAAIRELHAALGNKWSKIATHLPGRTDNEIKNYWRTRIQKRPVAAANNTQQQQQSHRAPASTTTMAMAAGESASSSSASPASHDDSSAVGDLFWCAKPKPERQAFCYAVAVSDDGASAASQSQKTMMTAAAAVGVDSGSASSPMARQDIISSAAAGDDGYSKQTIYGYPYYLELTSASDGVRMVDAESFWNVVDNFGGTTLLVPDTTL